MSDVGSGGASRQDERRPVTLFELAGGRAWFDELVERFYAGVAGDEVLRPLYPEEDLGGARERLAGFLVQYWGGPDDYSRQRGHPRLRMRHLPYPIGARERDRWVHHMTAAVDAGGLAPEARAVVLDYVERAATAMINQPTEGDQP